MSATTRWVVVDDTDTDIQYSGPWFADSKGTQDNMGNFGPVYQSTLHGATLNASLSYNFTGSEVRVFGANNLRNDSGVLDPQWECFVDQISIGASTPFQFAENNWVFCEQDTLNDGPHVLTVNATVRRSQTFWFDQIQYVPSASVPLDGKAVLLDNLDPQVQSAFGAGWSSLGGGANMTAQPNSVFNLTFTGVSLSWYGFIPTELPHGATTGSYSVDNGTPSSFLLKGLPASSATLYNQKFFQTANLTQGNHQIVVLFQGNGQTTPLTLDYLVVQNGTSPVPPSNSTDSGSSPINSSSPDSSTSNPHSGGKNNTGAIVGGVVGGLVLIALTLLGIFCIRRRDRKIRLEEEKSMLEPQPFNYTPVPIQSSVLDGYQNSPQGQQSKIPGRPGNGNDAAYGHNQMPSFSNTDFSQPVSVDPPSTAPTSAAGTASSNVNTTGHQRAAGAAVSVPYVFPASTITTSSSRSEKEQREVEATAAALRTRGLPSPPLSDESSSSRVLMHQDSGLRLQRDTNEVVQEIPPQYTAG